MMEKITKISQVTQEVTFFLRNLGFSNYMIIKMYDLYHDSIIQLIKDNPYFLLEDFPRIGFKKIDEVSLKLGFDLINSYRIEAGIKYILGMYVSNGDTYEPYDKLLGSVKEFLNVSEDLVSSSLSDMAISGDLQITNMEGETLVYFYSFYRAECDTAKKLKKLNDDSKKLFKINSDYKERIEKYQHDKGIILSDNQKLAIETSLFNPITIITGGPGTGKTTIINCIVDIFEHSGLKVSLAAPTGRAAKRIMETSGHFAQTVHRLLGYYYDERINGMNFSMNEENTLNVNAIILDEVSMMDLTLFNSLLKAINIGTRLILVGDKDQLPSVGCGNVLSDLIDSEYFSVVRLGKIYRQGEESLIIDNAHRINKGDYPLIVKENDSDFIFYPKESQDDIAKEILNICSHYDSKDIQVLSPTKKGKVGTLELNEKLHELFNPKEEGKDEIPFGKTYFRVGDRVMQIKNNYRLEYKMFTNSKTFSLINPIVKLGEDENSENIRTGQGVFNGEIGVIYAIDKEERSLVVLYDDEKYVKYEYIDLDEIEHAYAITIHKSQGSEFSTVVIPSTWFMPMLSTRSIIYTGITRGKDKVIIVGDTKYLNMMVDNNVSGLRKSGLKYRLVSTFDGL